MTYMRDSTGRRLDAFPVAPQRKPTIVLFGDSRTADCHYLSGNLSYSTNMSWFDWGNYSASGGPVLDVIANAGVGGNTTIQMAARIAADVFALAPDYMTLWGGTNDPWTTTTDVDASLGRMYSMMDQARALGIHVFLISETPANSKGTGYPAYVLYYNDRLRAYAAANASVEYWDFHSLVVDPTNVNGYNKNTMLRDGLHLGPLGASTIGNLVVAPKLARLATKLTVLPTSGIDTQGINATSRNVASNPLMTGTTGTVGSGHTGTLPTGWTSGGNVVACSIVARPDGFGNDLKAILSATSGSSVFLTHTLIPARFVQGKRYVLEAALGIDAATDIASVALYASIFGQTGGEYRRGFGYPVQNTAAGDSLALGDRIIRSRPFTAPVDTYTGASIACRIGPSASTAVATIRLGRISLKQID